MKPIEEIAQYCAENIEDYELRVRVAIGIMDRMRCPLYIADASLYDSMYDLAHEWCDDHEISVDFFDDIDVEDILFTEV